MSGLPILTHEYIMKGDGDIGNIDISVGEYLLEKLKENPNPFLIDAETGADIPNSALLQRSVALAECLRNRGIKPDDVVGICSENRLEYAIPVLASLAIGASVSTLNPLYTTDELKHVLSISKPRMIFCSPFTAHKVKEVQAHFPFIEEIVIFDGHHSSEGFTKFTNLTEKSVDVNLFQCTKIKPRESVAVILCSSGTTGLPKCVDLTHSNLMCFIKLLGEETGYFIPEENSAMLGLVPFFHGYGLCVLICSIASSIKLIVMAKFEEKTFLESIQNYRISSISLVPPLVVFLAKHPLVDKYDLSSVVNVTCGAAPLSKDIQMLAKKRLRLSNDIKQAYGMTELSVAITLMPKIKSKTGSVGVVVNGMECKIIDIDTGKALPPFKDGELCFRGPFVMKGYRNDPRATADTIRSDGWLHTGDVGYYDEEGFIYIVDRLKELIKFKGFQVAPAEIEALLLTNPKVKDAAVIGLPNEEAGELPMAFVVKQIGVEVTEQEIKNFVAGKVSPQKRLHLVKFVSEIPKNPSGKILRRELRQLLKKSKL